MIFHRLAIGNEETVVEMQPHNPHNEGGTGIGKGGNAVALKKLDSFNLHNVSLIKIDVEGLEIDVIEGAKETILRERPVMLVEIMGGTGYETASPEQRAVIHERMDKITQLGYTVQPIGMHDYLCLPKNKPNLRAR